jgi:hypothetical protein
MERETAIYFRGLNWPKGGSLCDKQMHGHIDLQFAGMGEKLSEVKTHYRYDLMDKQLKERFHAYKLINEQSICSQIIKGEIFSFHLQRFQSII